MTYHQQPQREDYRRNPVPHLKTKDRAVVAQQSRLRRLVSESHLKNLRGKRPNVAHTFEGVDERDLEIFQILCKRFACRSKQLTRRNLQVFLDVQGLRKESVMFQGRDPQSQQGTYGGGNERGGWVTKEHMHMKSHHQKVDFK